MTRTNIAVTSAQTYTHLMNGGAPSSNRTGLFCPGEPIQLRSINDPGMTYFDVRIQGFNLSNNLED